MFLSTVALPSRTRGPKGRLHTSNTLSVVTPSGVGGERERCESFSKKFILTPD